MKMSPVLLVLLAGIVGSCRLTRSSSASLSEPEIETGFAEVNGTRLYYEVAGTGDPIVLIHGGFGDRRYFDGQFEALARLHRVLRYDIRGFGKSMMPEEGVPYSDFEDLEALMAHLDIDRAHLAGFSLGSTIAVDFCLAFPDRCSSVIAIGPWFYGYDSPVARAMWQGFTPIGAAAVNGGRSAALEQLLAATWWYPDKVPPRAFDRLKAIWSDHEFWHFKNPDPRRYVTPPAAEQLERITATDPDHHGRVRPRRLPGGCVRDGCQDSRQHDARPGRRDALHVHRGTAGRERGHARLHREAAGR